MAEKNGYIGLIKMCEEKEMVKLHSINFQPVLNPVNMK